MTSTASLSGVLDMPNRLEKNETLHHLVTLDIDLTSYGSMMRAFLTTEKVQAMKHPMCRSSPVGCLATCHVYRAGTCFWLLQIDVKSGTGW